MPTGASHGPRTFSASTRSPTATASAERQPQPLQRQPDVAPLPGEEGPERNQQQQRQDDRPEGEVEIGRAHRDLLARHRLERQRIERADEHREAGHAEQQVVEHEASLAAHRREQAAGLQRGRAPGEQRQRAADEEAEDHQDEEAALRVDREGMNRGQHAGAHEEGAHQRQREGEDREQHRPDLQRIALLDHDGRMNQRGGDQPGHEAGILDRVPEPPAAPAKFVIGPPGAHGDADGEEHPGGQRPRPHPARPGGIDAALDQGRHREGEGDREADIARVEEGRMEGECRVLQDRVQAIALDRRRGRCAGRGWTSAR